MRDPFYYFEMLLSSGRKSYVSTLLSSLYLYHKRTYYHSLHVAMLSLQIGEKIGLSEKRLCILTEGALLHDVGKMKMPLRILDSPDPLTDEEFRIIRKHPLFSYDKIHEIKEPHSHTVELVGLMHHVYMDGSGYPSKGEVPPEVDFERIPLEAKITCIADIYDAMVSVRSYKDTYSDTFAVSELYKMVNAGKVDPKSVAVLDELIHENELLLRHAGRLSESTDFDTRMII